MPAFLLWCHYRARTVSSRIIIQGAGRIPCFQQVVASTRSTVRGSVTISVRKAVLADLQSNPRFEGPAVSLLEKKRSI